MRALGARRPERSTTASHHRRVIVAIRPHQAARRHGRHPQVPVGHRQTSPRPPPSERRKRRRHLPRNSAERSSHDCPHVTQPAVRIRSALHDRPRVHPLRQLPPHELPTERKVLEDAAARGARRSRNERPRARASSLDDHPRRRWVRLPRRGSRALRAARRGTHGDPHTGRGAHARAPLLHRLRIPRRKSRHRVRRPRQVWRRRPQHPLLACPRAREATTPRS